MSVYGCTGVAKACLDLQDQYNADVNLLMAAHWLASRHLKWRNDDVAELAGFCAEWRVHCVLPARRLRRFLASCRQEALYQQAKELELAVERRQLEMIEEWIASRPLEHGQGDLVAYNVGCYLRMLPGADGRDLLAVLPGFPVAGPLEPERP